MQIEFVNPESSYMKYRFDLDSFLILLFWTKFKCMLEEIMFKSYFYPENKGLIYKYVKPL